MFNTYEETINVPLVFSNPLLFSQGAKTEALASLVDVLPTLLSLSGSGARDELRGRDLTPVLAANASPRRGDAGVDLSPAIDHPLPAESVQDAIHFTFDYHQAATAMKEAPGQPNRIRAIRTKDAKYALYYDPSGRAASEYELYDLAGDPLEENNLLGVRSGAPRSSAARRLRRDLAERLEQAMDHCRTRPDQAASG